jgi:hypothetical protein
MPSRRAFTVGLGAVMLVRPVRAAPAHRLALLVGAPWKGETFLGNGVGRLREALATRGFGSGEMITSTEAVDRKALSRRLDEVSKRIAPWREGELFLYYDGHGMYSRATRGVPEAGLQLTGDRDDPGSSMLWREVWEAIRAPRGVSVLVLPDCCHTNLLAGRLPPNVTALIMKSEPQDTLTCRTGGAMFGEGAARKRYGVISYYAGGTVASARTVGDWLARMDSAIAKDAASGTLAPLRRPHLMIEGDAGSTLPGRPMDIGARSRTL